MSIQTTYKVNVTFKVPAYNIDHLHRILINSFHKGNISQYCTDIDLPIPITTPGQAEKPTQTAESEGDEGGRPGLRP